MFYQTILSPEIPVFELKLTDCPDTSKYDISDESDKSYVCAVGEKLFSAVAKKDKLGARTVDRPCASIGAGRAAT